MVVVVVVVLRDALQARLKVHLQKSDDKFSPSINVKFWNAASDPMLVNVGGDNEVAAKESGPEHGSGAGNGISSYATHFNNAEQIETNDLPIPSKLWTEPKCSL